MTALQVRPRPPARWLRHGLALTVAVGIVAGWLLRPAQNRTFDEIYPLLSPVGFAALCLAALLQGSKQSRWVVPLLLIPFVTSAALRPLDPSFGALGIGACVLAIVASLCDRKYLAIAGVLLCCASISISIFLGGR